LVKNFSLVIIAVFLLGSTAARAHDVLVIQGLHVTPFDEAFRGFRSVCAAQTRRLYLTDLERTDITRMIREEKPSLILAIGTDALTSVKKIKDIPILYLMVLNPQSLVQDSNNITGVSLAVQPERQLSAFRQVLPHVRKIGLPFDPDKSGAFVTNAQNAAAKLGIELLSKSVHSSRGAAAALDGMKGNIDAFWLLPDTTVVNPETVDLLLLSAIESGIPVLTFSEKYAEKGALLSLEVDATEAGKQAGEMANSIMA